METNPPKAEPLKRKRRWYQFSLRTLLIVVLIVAIPCALLGRKIERKRRERKAVDAIRKLGGGVDYDNLEGPDCPDWLRPLLGENFFNEVDWVSWNDATDEEMQNLNDMPQLRVLLLNESHITDAGIAILNEKVHMQGLVLSHARISDAGLKHLNGMTKLLDLWLDHTDISDAGLENLKGLTKLESLVLSRTQVSDAGLNSLKGLTQLQTLCLNNTRVTDAGIEDLQKSLPKCQIVH
jgi:hypothetical protein